MYKEHCIFCQIAQAKAPAHRIWEDDHHLAFLGIFPNTKGMTVVIPKEHQPSYIFDAEDAVVQKLVIASKRVATLLDSYFDDVARCGLIFEGYGVDHLHAKLYPMHGTGKDSEWQAIESQDVKTYFETYPGYLSSNDSQRAEDSELAQLAQDIRQHASTKT